MSKIVNVPEEVLEEVEKAIKIYKDFHWGLVPKKIIKAKIEIPKVLCVLGMLKAVIYETQKKGDKVPTNYFHAFNVPFPFLCADDNDQLFIIGGNYKIKKEGIVD